MQKKGETEETTCDVSCIRITSFDSAVEASVKDAGAERLYRSIFDEALGPDSICVFIGDDSGGDSCKVYMEAKVDSKTLQSPRRLKMVAEMESTADTSANYIALLGVTLRAQINRFLKHPPTVLTVTVGFTTGASVRHAPSPINSLKTGVIPVSAVSLLSPERSLMLKKDLASLQQPPNCLDSAFEAGSLLMLLASPRPRDYILVSALATMRCRGLEGLPDKDTRRVYSNIAGYLGNPVQQDSATGGKSDIRQVPLVPLVACPLGNIPLLYVTSIVPIPPLYVCVSSKYLHHTEVSLPVRIDAKIGKGKYVSDFKGMTSVRSMEGCFLSAYYNPGRSSLGIIKPSHSFGPR